MGLFSKNSLGIDIGASSIKMVEISSLGNKNKLENYLEFRLPPAESSLTRFYGENLMLLSDQVAEVLQALLKKTKIKQRKAAFSLPDFSTFFTTFSLPPMNEKEVAQAIEFEARHYIPLPLSKVTFDWQVIEREETMSGVKLRVLLVAVPNRVLESYQRMASLAQLAVEGMEAEVFALIRSSIPKEKAQSPVCLVDIGWQTTNVSIVENKRLKISHSFDVSGIGLTTALSTALNISFSEAEELKIKYGLDSEREDVARVLLEKINYLALEIESLCDDFQNREERRVEDIILAGASASLLGLKEYLAEQTKRNVEIANPFAGVVYPALLSERLKELGPSFGVALGVGMMGRKGY